MTNSQTGVLAAEERPLPAITIDGVEFQFWSDGDLEVELDPDSNNRWVGHYFNRADALKLRDWLIEALK